MKEYVFINFNLLFVYQIALNATVCIKTYFVLQTSTAMVNIPVEGTTVSGSCGNSTQSISITWSPDTKQPDKLDIEFSLNATTKSYRVSKMSVTVDPTGFPASAGTYS